MKQVIPFIKDISFNTRIAEITSIALEHDLQMENDDSIVGIFTVSGNYKINEISINEESFKKDISFDITLDDKYDTSKVKIDIDDFYYEVINEELLRVHINVLIDNLVYAKKEEKREVDSQETDNYEEEINNYEEDIIEQKKQIIEEINIPEVNLKDEEERKDEDVVDTEQRDDIKASINASFLETTEKYVTYKVHIIRENDTIESIMEKYDVSKDDLAMYNAIDNIMIGSKIIIPVNNE